MPMPEFFDDPISAMNAGKRWCYAVTSDSPFHEGKGYVPTLVVEDCTTHGHMLGKGVASSPWYVGMTIEQAQETVRWMNAKRDIDEHTAMEILDSSIRASLVKRKRESDAQR